MKIIWLLAKKTFAKGSRMKTQMSKATFAICILFLFAFFCLLGSSINTYLYPSDDTVATDPIYYVVNMPDSFGEYLSSEYGEDVLADCVTETNDAYYDYSHYDKFLNSGEATIVLVFPTDFEENVRDIDSTERPEIITYYLPSDDSSYDTHEDFVSNVLPGYGAYLQDMYGRIALSGDIFAISTSSDDAYVSEDSTLEDAVDVLSHMLIPFFLFISIIYSAMESGVMSIAGEKERGTFAALLLSPIRRIDIVLGTEIGTVMHAMIPVMIMIPISMLLCGAMTFTVFILLTLITLSMAILLSAIVLIISILNRGIVSAQTNFLPIFFILLIVCVSAMQKDDAPSFIYYYIPFFGHFYGITAVLVGEYPLYYLLGQTFICLISTAILLHIAEKLLHVERFTVLPDTSIAAEREKKAIRRNAELDKKYAVPEKNKIFGYHFTSRRKSFRLLLDHLALPLTILSIVQPLALLLPLHSFLKTKDSSETIIHFVDGSAMPALTDMLKAVVRVLNQLMTYQSFIIGMSIGYVVVILIYVIIVRVFERSPLSTIGFASRDVRGNRALFCYGRGLLIGFLMLSAVYVLILLTGQARVTGFGIDKSSIGLFICYLLMWIPQGASEEIMLRGYMMPHISARFGKAAGVMTTSVVFSLLHTGNAGFAAIPLINLALIALFFALLSLHTNEIWTVCAAHSVWNFSQGNLYGMQVSGTQNAAHLVHTEYSEKALDVLTGGDFGPEGGLFVTGIVIISLLILLVFRHKLNKTTL